MKLGIVITTYKRRDNKTPELLTRAIQSVFNQTHDDFKLLVIGDRYEDDLEFKNICTPFISNKFYFENLPFAAERDVYTDKHIIWNCAGANANNYGIDLSVAMGYEYVCHLDHDDWWYPNHLKEINDAIEHTEAEFVFTKSTHQNSYLPNINTTEKYVYQLPIPCGMIHSSMCMNFKKIPLRHRNVFLETGKLYPGDADLWARTANYIQLNNLKSYYINKLTCNHEEEGYEKIN